MALTDDQQKRIYDLAEAGDLRLQGLEQRLDRVEANQTKHYGSLRGWGAAMAAKLGVSREEAIALDPTHKAE